ncbi:MAG TPA: AAA family ATPase [Bacillus sp. (in: firmicutes)]|uniref:AAA family ATPase n=1 Tax=Bacillus litorisediminis TaxID=2922713 RepID=UPI001FAB68B8|nr:AAA family ATPase [Bacillus litorisediminis]HWO77050.1 AAA family ATPase [Bacillus sp. (in: firmicutes)]
MTEEVQTKKKKRGEMIVVCSAKGGVGKTTLTVNLAVALHKKNIKINVLDGDFQFGDVSLALDLQTTFTIKDVIEEIERLDSPTLLSYLCNHDSGVRVLPAPERPEYADLVTDAAITTICDFLVQDHDYVIVDTAAGLNEKTLQFLEKADQIVVVTNLEMATLKNTKLMLDTIKMLELDDKVQLVVNRATMESVISAADIPDILNVEDPILVPNDFQMASQALNIGIPFVISQGKSDMAKAYFRMAELLTSRREIAPLPASKGPSLLSKFFGRKKVKEGMVE